MIREGTSALPAQRAAGADEDRVGAVERYKEIIGLAGEAVERMRTADRARVADLVGRLIETQELMARAIAQERDVRVGVSVVWEQAVEALWNERWFAITPVPPPNEKVPARPQNDYVQAMDAAYRNLVESLQKRSLFGRKG
ncbi:hypothetical protein GCM10022243_11720 [Saccharothrix violaceirubra]|uniref:Uncharacterized protein n=1 Tax=Saccharothrix violaceirubra TaxID=413306 RepID=A0A7W7WZ55_9PSEU|nr:hypothetical protein [Saccharothrix violaceirubra]MBB4968671.1 hypothetical protein [Saccharothrix violaceirubra]